MTEKKKVPVVAIIVGVIVIVAIIAVIVFMVTGKKDSGSEPENKDADVDVIISYIDSANSMASNPAYNVAPGTTFRISMSYGQIMLSVSNAGSSSDSAYLESEWGNARGTYSIKSADFREIDVRYLGVVQDGGKVTWNCDGNNAMLTYSDKLSSKFN